MRNLRGEKGREGGEGGGRSAANRSSVYGYGPLSVVADRELNDTARRRGSHCRLSYNENLLLSKSRLGFPFLTRFQVGNRGKIRIKDAYSVRLVMDLTFNPDKSMVHRRCERRDGAKGRHAHALSWGKKEGGAARVCAIFWRIFGTRSRNAMRTIFSREPRSERRREEVGEWGVEFVTRFVQVPPVRDRRFLNVEESEAKTFEHISRLAFC